MLMHILIYYKFTLLKGIHFYVPKTENTYVVIYSFYLFFLRNMQVMLNGILKLQHIFQIKHDTQVIQKKSFYIIYNLVYAWAFYGFL